MSTVTAAEEGTETSYHDETIVIAPPCEEDSDGFWVCVSCGEDLHHGPALDKHLSKAGSHVLARRCELHQTLEAP